MFLIYDFPAQNVMCISYIPMHVSRAIAQVVIPRVPPAAARVRSQPRPVEFVVYKMAQVQVFFRVLGFSIQILVPPNTPYSPIILG